MGEKKTNALSKSMKLIYVYAMATGAIFTFMCYWDGIFMSYTGPGTFLAFALMTLAVLPTAFVYAEFSTMLPSTGSCLVFLSVHYFSCSADTGALLISQISLQAAMKSSGVVILQPVLHGLSDVHL